MPSESTEVVNPVVEEENEKIISDDELHGLLVYYKDDNLDEQVKLALKGKSRVRYKCMDTFSNFLAFGTSGGAIYLFELPTITHSSCSLLLKEPCDQGPIEVIRFLPNLQADTLLIIIGTSNGSIVIFQLIQLNDGSCQCESIYRAEKFTGGRGIKLIDHERELFNPAYSFTKLYICDTADRLYILDSSTIEAHRNKTLRSLYSNDKPSLIFKVDNSKINQISAHRSQLLISTDETTRLYNEEKDELITIGKKKRKPGFYGACFFNPYFKPLRILQTNNQLSHYDNNQQVSASNDSLNELENLLIFVARPIFRLWQVNNQSQVMFTHQFETSIKIFKFKKVIELTNEPLKTGEVDDPSDLIDCLDSLDHTPQLEFKLNHFQKLIPIYSSTLGNLILSYSQHNIFIIDPIGAKLIVSYHQDEPIFQVCCKENEIFVWSSTTGEFQFHLKRLVLQAPTQFVLELHRLRKFKTLIMFVEQFNELFRSRMALPLHGPNVITTEGGLLRTLLLNAWQTYKNKKSDTYDEENIEDNFVKFKSIVDGIIEESIQLRESLENLSDSRFFLNMTTENIDRLCSEPYMSLVSLEVSIKDLHSNHVIHFSKSALNRHKTVANLSSSIQKLRDGSARQTSKSNYDLTERVSPPPSARRQIDAHAGLPTLELNETEILVERCKPKKSKQKKSPEQGGNRDGDTYNGLILLNEEPVVANKLLMPTETSMEKHLNEVNSNSSDECTLKPDFVRVNEKESKRCKKCRWPRSRSHLEPLDSSQKIQSKYIEDNLMNNFIENVEEIEKRALEHGLWHVFLKCLASRVGLTGVNSERDPLDDYITCCIMLDDVRLLELEQFLITRFVHGEDEIFARLLACLKKKANLEKKLEGSTQEEICLKCGQVLELEPLECVDPDQAKRVNLVNVLEQFIMKRNVDANRIIGTLLKHTDLLNNSTIPISFYLRAIDTATKYAYQSMLS